MSTVNVNKNKKRLKIMLELQYLIKNKLQYHKHLKPLSARNQIMIYNKYKTIIDEHVSFLDKNVKPSER